jgi:hypothetical protein
VACQCLDRALGLAFMSDAQSSLCASGMVLFERRPQISRKAGYCAGADPWKVIKQLRDKLRLNAAPVQVGGVVSV